VKSDPSGARERAEAALAHADRAARDAIRSHERAAIADDAAAAAMEHGAQLSADPRHRALLLERARAARERAERTRMRARDAQRRLRTEGMEAPGPRE
jgi:hypothetical protein